jgi:hypothetical protein
MQSLTRCPNSDDRYVFPAERGVEFVASSFSYPRSRSASRQLRQVAEQSDRASVTV